MRRWFIIFCLAAIVALPWLTDTVEVMTFSLPNEDFAGSHPSLSSFRPDTSSFNRITIGLLMWFSLSASFIIGLSELRAVRPSRQFRPCDFCGMPSVGMKSKRDGFQTRSFCEQHRL